MIVSFFCRSSLQLPAPHFSSSCISGGRTLTAIVNKQIKYRLSLHALGVICGLTAAVWLGAAEAPTKLVTAGYSPFAISSAMVCGVFLSRWTFPTLLKGTAYVFADLANKKHLILWALLAGVLWAEGNPLTVFAVRD